MWFTALLLKLIIKIAGTGTLVINIIKRSKLISVTAVIDIPVVVVIGKEGKT